MDRGLAALMVIARSPGERTLAQISEQLGFHRSITRRLLISLESAGFVTRTSAGHYRIGPTVAELNALAPPRLREAASPVLHTLARSVNATACLVEVAGGAAVTTVVAEPPTDGPRYSYRLGSRDPIDRGAGGLAALASGPWIDGESPRVDPIRDAGYIVTHGELNPGVHGTAAPVPGWGVRAAIYLVTADVKLAESAVEAVQAAAQELQRGSDLDSGPG